MTDEPRVGFKRVGKEYMPWADTLEDAMTLTAMWNKRGAMMPNKIVIGDRDTLEVYTVKTDSYGILLRKEEVNG